MDACAAGAILTGPFGIFVGIPCAVACMEIFAVAVAAAVSIGAIMIKSCLNQLKIDLLACGVNIAED